jgi:hypothetical protein
MGLILGTNSGSPRQADVGKLGRRKSEACSKHIFRKATGCRQDTDIAGPWLVEEDKQLQVIFAEIFEVMWVGNRDEVDVISALRRKVMDSHVSYLTAPKPAVTKASASHLTGFLRDVY